MATPVACPHCGVPIDRATAARAMVSYRKYDQQPGRPRKVQHSETCKTAEGPRCIDCRRAAKGRSRWQTRRNKEEK